MPRIHRFALSVLLFASLFADLQAQPTVQRDEVPVRFDVSLSRFEHLTAADGLPENSVLSLLQDQLGFLWFGTQNGLVRYDGQTMVTFTHDPDDQYSIGGRTIVSLYEDHAGDLWIGMWTEGLAHYDRKTGRFTTYRHDPADSTSLSNNFILHLYEDNRGDLWVVTGEQHLDRFNRATGTFTRFRHDQGDLTSLSHDRVPVGGIRETRRIPLLEEEQGALWVGTQGGLNRFNPQAQAFTRYQHDPADANSLSHDFITHLTADARKQVWVATLGGGLNRFDPQNQAFTSYRHDPEDSQSLVSDTVYATYEDQQGLLWVMTQGGLDLLDSETEVFTHFMPGSPGGPSAGYMLVVHEDEAGLWFLSPVGAINFYDRETGTFIHLTPDPEDPQSLSPNVASFLKDRSGTVWAGTINFGLNKLERTVRFPLFAYNPDDRTSLGDSRVWALYEAPSEPGVLWVGTQTGLDRFDRATNRFTHYRHDPQNPRSLSAGQVIAVHEDASQQLWVGTRFGLNRMDRRAGTFTRYSHNTEDASSLSSDDVWAILSSRDGMLWIGTGQGLDRLDPKHETFTHYTAGTDQNSLSQNEIRFLVEDRTGLLWIGTDQGGLNRFDPTTETFTAYYDRFAGPLSVTTILEDRSGRLWVGDYVNGFYHVDTQTGPVRRYTTADGLPSNSVLSILEDEQGLLWLGTANGLSRFDPASGVFKNYDTTHGLQGRGWFWNGTAYKSADGTLFFGGREGFNAIDPSRLANDPVAPEVALTGFDVFNETVHVGPDSPLKENITVAEAITLAHDKNDFTFRFAALHFSRPDENRIAYMLEPYDVDWVAAGNERQVRYTNLSPGAYVFRMKAANPDGVWNERERSIEITILPPWWRTAWAYLLYGFLFIAGVFAVDRLQRRRLRRQERTLALQKEKELMAEQADTLRSLDKEKSRLFANISHEFRTPLTLILGPLEDLEEGLHGPVTQSAQTIVHTAIDNGRRLLRLVNQLLDLSRLESGRLNLQARRSNLASFVRRITQAFVPLAERKHIDFDVALPDEPLSVYFDPEQFEKVVTNLLGNAFKFTDKGGSIQLALTSTYQADPPGSAVLTVRDSGRGISHEDLPRLFDRFYQVDPSSTRRNPGTGIGLALVKELVVLHHGTIGVESTLGAGSTFTVQLPLGDAHLTPREIVTPEAGGFDDRLSALLDEAVPVILADEIQVVSPAMDDVDTEQDEGTDQTTVLVADDNADVRAYVTRHLESRYRVLEAADGREALEKTRHFLPDLVVSDVMMPEMNGYALCQAIKADPETDFIPVILLTAKAGIEDKIEGLEGGADDYISKPFNVRELEVRVENLIALRQRLKARLAQAGGGAARSAAEEAPDDPVPSADDRFLEQVRAEIEERLADETFNVAALSSALGVGRTTLYRRLEALEGISPMELAWRMRLDRADRMLQDGVGNVSEVAYAVGFKSVSHFSQRFHAAYGMSPSAYASQAGTSKEAK